MPSLMWESGWIKYTWERRESEEGRKGEESGDIIETQWGVTERGMSGMIYTRQDEFFHVFVCHLGEFQLAGDPSVLQFIFCLNDQSLHPLSKRKTDVKKTQKQHQL